jgi:hypothetical protein
MNERIDELMIQAGARFEFLHEVHYDDFQYRKFAELIVKECIELAGNHYDARGAVNDIKQHFGVEL